MSDLFLDLRNKPRVVDFLVDHLAFATPKIRAEAERWISMYEEGKHVGTDRLAEFAQTFGWEVLPARRALEHYFSAEGGEEEWRRILASVRPSTANLLKRFRTAAALHSIHETLRAAESGDVLREGELLEIDEVRKQLRQDFWREKKKKLAPFVTESAREITAARERLKKLREFALASFGGAQDEIFSKLARFEDRILFEGEIVPLSLLDEEIRYYTDQQEISNVES